MSLLPFLHGRGSSIMHPLACGAQAKASRTTVYRVLRRVVHHQGRLGLPRTLEDDYFGGGVCESRYLECWKELDAGFEVRPRKVLDQARTRDAFAG